MGGKYVLSCSAPSYSLMFYSCALQCKGERGDPVTSLFMGFVEANFDHWHWAHYFLLLLLLLGVSGHETFLERGLLRTNPVERHA